MQKYIQSHVIPGVLGPEGGFYLTDHHHMAKAMTLSKHSDMPVYGCAIGDLRQDQVVPRTHQRRQCPLRDGSVQRLCCVGVVAPAGDQPLLAPRSAGFDVLG